VDVSRLSGDWIVGNVGVGIIARNLIPFVTQFEVVVPLYSIIAVHAP